MDTPSIRVFVVTVGTRPATFNDIDVAIAYLRGELLAGRAATPSIESFTMTEAEYLAAVEREEASDLGR